MFNGRGRVRDHGRDHDRDHDRDHGHDQWLPLQKLHLILRLLLSRLRNPYTFRWLSSKLTEGHVWPQFWQRKYAYLY